MGDGTSLSTVEKLAYARDEAERLRKWYFKAQGRIQELQEALQPFAKIADEIEKTASEAACELGECCGSRTLGRLQART